MHVMTASDFLRIQVCAIGFVIAKLLNGLNRHVKPSPTVIPVFVLILETIDLAWEYIVHGASSRQ